MKIQNERLQVRFAALHEMNTQRFDHTAMIASVVLDGRHEFCTPEQVLPERRTTNGRGLCGEFVLPGAAEGAKAGEWFVKPGVGLLRQKADGMPYDMWTAYERNPFEAAADVSADRVVFVQRGAVCGGYGVEIKKTYALQDNRLFLDIEVCNTGEKEYELQEYQHNFVSPGSAEVGPGYELEVSCDRALETIERQTLRQGDEIVLPSAVRVEGERVVFMDNLRGKVMYHRSEEVGGAKPYRWTLRYRDTGAAVSEETDFGPSRIDIWAVEHCVCTEFYNTVRLAPGETARWRRTWTFDA